MCRYIILLCLCAIYTCSSAQRPAECNRTLRYNFLKSKLDSVICIPNGYQIMKIFETDLNDDGLTDKVVRWQKIKLSDGDTIFHSIYIKMNDGKLQSFKKLGNLEPLYFNNYSSKSGNTFHDSIKSMYSYPTTSEVEFNTKTISLKFYIDAVNIKKLFFTYSTQEKTWILTREIQWFAPIQYEDDRKQEYDRASKMPILIEDFNMLKYMDW
jgi:hypothetical protein